MADKATGWLRKRERADGMTWLWCYQKLRTSDGVMVENSVKLGLISDIEDETSAWLKVGELGLISKYINNSICPNPTFGDLCTIYIKEGLPFRKKGWSSQNQGHDRNVYVSSQQSHSSPLEG